MLANQHATLCQNTPFFFDMPNLMDLMDPYLLPVDPSSVREWLKPIASDLLVKQPVTADQFIAVPFNSVLFTKRPTRTAVTSRSFIFVR